MFGINNLEYNKINEEFGYVEFNGIKLYVTSDKQMFNATILTKSINCHVRSASSGANNAKWLDLIEDSPDDFIYVEGNGTQSYKGWYAKLDLLQFILGSINPIRGLAWYRGNEWKNKDVDGLIYLVQPPEFVGTNTFKIGESKNFNNRLNNYGKGTLILATVDVTNRSDAEIQMKEHFDKNGAIKVKGNEYYECKDSDEALEIFQSVNFPKDLVKENGWHIYNYGEQIHGQQNNKEEEKEEKKKTRKNKKVKTQINIQTININLVFKEEDMI